MPAGQLTGTAVPTGQNLATGHCRQSDSASDPVVPMYVPEGQGVSVLFLAPRGQKNPAGHRASGAACPPVQYEPAVHKVHSSALFKLVALVKRPGGHCSSNVLGSPVPSGQKCPVEQAASAVLPAGHALPGLHRVQSSARAAFTEAVQRPAGQSTAFGVVSVPFKQ